MTTMSVALLLHGAHRGAGRLGRCRDRHPRRRQGVRWVRRNDRTVALRDVTLHVHDREFLCMVGASGCGKSTLLNLVAGLDKPTAGTIDAGGRKVAFMFQEPTLFPWLTAGAERRPGAQAARVTERRSERAGSRSCSPLVHLGRSTASVARTSCRAACGSARRWRGCWRRRPTSC